MNRLDRTAIFLVSAVGLAYEITLMRVLDVAEWQNFAYMVISLAMLGFAAAGTYLSLLRHRLVGREPLLMCLGCWCLSLTLVPCYALGQWIPFETFELVGSIHQWLYLLVLYLVFSLPFFLVSVVLTLAFYRAGRRVGRVYFLNMAGSGAGALGVVGLLFWFNPATIPYLLTIPAALCFLLLTPGLRSRKVMGFIGIGVVVVMLVSVGYVPITISPYKPISYALQAPDARVVAEAQSPMSVLDVVDSRQIRETPGQLSNYPYDRQGPLPDQRGMYFDGGGPSAIHHLENPDRFERFAFLDYVTGALPYHLLRRPDVLVVGAGGGTGVLSALSHGASHVTALEVDPSVFSLMVGPMRSFSGGLYEREDVTPVHVEGRQYLREHRAKFDLIDLGLSGSFTASLSGVHALNEQYLLTVESVRLFLNRLTDRGLVAVTRWIQSPPRGGIKLFATFVEALEQRGVSDPGRHLAVIRSWNTLTLVAGRSPLGPDRIDTVRQFSRERWFDRSHHPGLESAETNRYVLLEEPVYFRSARRILSGDRERFFVQYPFYVRPPTDNRPYFSRFFKWSSWHRLWNTVGRGWTPFVEWGYLVLIGTLLQGALVGFVLVVFPLLLPGGGVRMLGFARSRFFTLLYFGAIGLSFMFLEIAFMQQFVRFLTYPIYAVSVVLTSFLVFSGAGSYVSDHLPLTEPGQVAGAAAGIVLIGGGYLGLLPWLFEVGAGWSDPLKIPVSLLLVAPIAGLMGMFFPSGLRVLARRERGAIPWAWAVNGCLSVMGAVGARLLAIHLGFRMLVLVALAGYVLAALSLDPLKRTFERF